MPEQFVGKTYREEFVDHNGSRVSPKGMQLGDFLDLIEPSVFQN